MSFDRTMALLAFEIRRSHHDEYEIWTQQPGATDGVMSVFFCKACGIPLPVPNPHVEPDDAFSHCMWCKQMIAHGVIDAEGNRL